MPDHQICETWRSEEVSFTLNPIRPARAAQSRASGPGALAGSQRPAAMPQGKGLTRIRNNFGYEQDMRFIPAAPKPKDWFSDARCHRVKRLHQPRRVRACDSRLRKVKSGHFAPHPRAGRGLYPGALCRHPVQARPRPDLSAAGRSAARGNSLVTTPSGLAATAPDVWLRFGWPAPTAAA